MRWYRRQQWCRIPSSVIALKQTETQTKTLKSIKKTKERVKKLDVQFSAIQKTVKEVTAGLTEFRAEVNPSFDFLKRMGWPSSIVKHDHLFSRSGLKFCTRTNRKYSSKKNLNKQTYKSFNSEFIYNSATLSSLYVQVVEQNM